MSLFWFLVASTLSNLCRFSTTANRSTLKILENKNVTQFVIPKLNLQPMVVSTIDEHILLYRILIWFAYIFIWFIEEFTYSSNCNDSCPKIGSWKSRNIMDSRKSCKWCSSWFIASRLSFSIKISRFIAGHISCNACSLGHWSLCCWLCATSSFRFSYTENSTIICLRILGNVTWRFIVFHQHRYWY